MRGRGVELHNAFLSNVPLGTANVLSYAMLVVVALFLVTAASVTYYYWKKNKKMTAALTTGSV